MRWIKFICWNRRMDRWQMDLLLTERGKWYYFLLTLWGYRRRSSRWFRWIRLWSEIRSICFSFMHWFHNSERFSINVGNFSVFEVWKYLRIFCGYVASLNHGLQRDIISLRSLSIGFMLRLKAEQRSLSSNIRSIRHFLKWKMCEINIFLLLIITLSLIKWLRHDVRN